MEKNNTAIEWLKNQLEKEGLISRFAFNEDESRFREFLERAKEIDKEQLIKSFRDGRIDGYILGTSYMHGSNRNVKYKTSEDYYNKTYANDTTKGLPEENSKRRGWHY